MKKELFYKIVDFLINKMGDPYSITENETYIFYSFFETPYNYTPFEVKDLGSKIKAGGYKGEELKKEICSEYNNLSKKWYNISYDIAKDKISFGEFEIGWAWGHKSDRFYPINKRSPILCYSKNLYSFTYKSKPRLMKPVQNSTKRTARFSDDIEKIMMGIDYTPQITAVAKHYIGTKDNFDVLEKILPNCPKVPKALRRFNVRDVQQLYTVLKNPNEVQRICQYLSDITKKIESFDTSVSEALLINNQKTNLYQVLCPVMKLEEKDYWLVRDYMNDLEKLGKKMSLKMTSKSRIEDEHRKMSKEIILLGVKEIKPHQIYIDQMKDFPIHGAQLIMDKARLLFESQSQDHCVATYHARINDGSCGIISIPWEDRHTSKVTMYTLELCKINPKGYFGQNTFRVNQVRGYRNESAPIELTTILSRHFATYEIKSEEVEGSDKKELVEDNLPF